MPYILFTLAPLLVSFAVATVGTMVLATSVSGRSTYFALATLVTLGLHSLITVLHETFRLVNPTPQAIYGATAEVDPPSDVELLISLFTVERVVVLAAAVLLAAPALVLLKHAMSRSGAA
jgi:hypothetical protein